MSKNLPTITSNIPRDLRNFVDRLRDMINGGGTNRLISAGDLVDAGIANIDGKGGLSLGGTVVFSTPPAPTNVQAAAAIRNVILEWDVPTYANHAYAEVWGSSTNNIGTAVLLGQTPGAVYTDPLGPSATRYYWVRFVNTQFTTGPYNSSVGTSATTGPEVDYLLDQLAGQITETELYTSLNTRINGIETNATAITTEATTRASADTALASSITTLSSNVDTNNTTLTAAIQTEATTRASADTALASSITTLSSTVDTNNTTLTAAIQTEATTRATQTGDISAKYSVKVDVAGHVSGFGLISTANNASPYSAFGVRANQFFIAPPATSQATAPSTGLYAGYVWVDTSVTPNVTKYYTGSTWSTTPQALPFVVQASPTTIGTVSVPAGVYIDSAFIQNAAISNAKIADAAIDSVKVASAAITTAKIADANITAAKIADANITTAKIADANITSAKIADANITTAKIANANITAAKIADANITLAKIDVASITNLSALSADLGSITAGTATFAVDANNYLKIDGPNQRIDVYSAGVLRVRIGKL